ncbi:probable 2-oxoglutarate-dependent dioxygenase AOP1 [Capsicum annuum]|uniref:probable 2-oxoglutarate-dependent dioxygenase AOP1 n=1 Tax=Capsicum annuum TaxID=4072 RepID=UPI001FB05380|nr:probable 2-oxoglutarate-dependent dioxygenase AOP1 [Capsicum annuum]
MDKNGQFIDVQYSSPHSYLFLVSDCLKAFTNGRQHCPPHQVILMGNKERYSMGFSQIPKEGYIIKVPEELVDEDTIAEARRGNVVTLESYCGITANTPNLI